MNSVLDKLVEYKSRHPFTVMWRIRRHAKVIQCNLHEGEEVLYAFGGQKDNNHFGFFNTIIVVLTNERLIVAQKRVFPGYSLNAITPDMFNDLQIISGLVWGAVNIDTVKEAVYVSNLSKSALPEIQKTITKFMITEKKKYPIREKNNE